MLVPNRKGEVYVDVVVGGHVWVWVGGCGCGCWHACVCDKLLLHLRKDKNEAICIALFTTPAAHEASNYLVAESCPTNTNLLILFSYVRLKVKAEPNKV